MAISLFAVIVCVTATWLVRIFQKRLTGPFRNVPGPWHTHFTNIPLKYATITGRRIYYIHNLHKIFGDRVRIAPNEMSCCNPHDFRQIHGGSGRFHKTIWYQAFSEDGTSTEDHNEFVLRDPKEHAVRRKTFAKAFSKSDLRRNWEAAASTMIRYAVQRMQEDASNNEGEVDCLKWWMFMTADISSRVSFGESFNLLGQGEKNDYVRALEAINLSGGLNTEFPFLKPLARILPSRALRKAFTSSAVIDQQGKAAVANSRQGGTHANVFSYILAEEEKDRGRVSDALLVNEATNFMVAGTDTTAITLAYVVWCVLSRPQLQKELVDEVWQLPAEFNDNDLEALPLLNAVISETLRLYGAAPGSLPRHAPPPGTKIGDVYVPHSAVVSTQSWSLHRNPKVWENPEVFDISRWMKESGLSEKQKMSYAPFSYGPRMCLGVHLAQMELRYATAVFFRENPNARLAPSTTEETMYPVNYFVIQPNAHQCRVIL